MPKFKVYCQQYVEEQAVFEVEADSADEAAAKADNWLKEGFVDNWTDGDDIIGREVYQVDDATGETVWTR